MVLPAGTAPDLGVADDIGMIVQIQQTATAGANMTVTSQETATTFQGSHIIYLRLIPQTGKATRGRDGGGAAEM